MGCTTTIMKLYSINISKIFLFLFLSLLTGCGDYSLNLDDGYVLFRTNADNRYILKEGYKFFNYSKKGINLEECLAKNPTSRQNCYAFSHGSNTIIESNVVELAIVDKFIFGMRIEPDHSDIPDEILHEIVPLQEYGYFIVNKNDLTVQTGLSKEDFFVKLKDLNIGPVNLEKINDGVNFWKALPEMLIGGR